MRISQESSVPNTRGIMNTEGNKGQELGNGSGVEGVSHTAEIENGEQRSGYSESDWQSNILKETIEGAIYSATESTITEVCGASGRPKRAQIVQDECVVMKMQIFNTIKAKEEDVSSQQEITNKWSTPQLGKPVQSVRM